MKIQAFDDLVPVERYCLVCRKRDRADRLLADVADANRWRAFYCVTCVTRGFAEKHAKKRAREAKKAARNDWRTFGGDYLVHAPPLQEE